LLSPKHVKLTLLNDDEWFVLGSDRHLGYCSKLLHTDFSAKTAEAGNLMQISEVPGHYVKRYRIYLHIRVWYVKARAENDQCFID